MQVHHRLPAVLPHIDAEIVAIGRIFPIQQLFSFLDELMNGHDLFVGGIKAGGHMAFGHNQQLPSLDRVLSKKAIALSFSKRMWSACASQKGQWVILPRASFSGLWIPVYQKRFLYELFFKNPLYIHSKQKEANTLASFAVCYSAFSISALLINFLTVGTSAGAHSNFIKSASLTHSSLSCSLATGVPEITFA